MILIHTSVKLVTTSQKGAYNPCAILIHTSVKLVTARNLPLHADSSILIHTSVKLVTHRESETQHALADFNPHEREARDDAQRCLCRGIGILIHTSVKLVTPRERRALFEEPILIHTSVKLVTRWRPYPSRSAKLF